MTGRISTLLIALWGVHLSALSGCAVPGENLSKKGLVTVERVSSREVEICRASAYRTDENLIVRGVLRRRDYSSVPLLVHVDATVLAADGQILKEAIGRDVSVRRRPVGKSVNYLDTSDFEIRLAVAPPEGGTIRLVCHDGSRDIHFSGG